MSTAEQPIVPTAHHHKVTVIIEDLVTGLTQEITMEKAVAPQVIWVEPEEKGISIFDLNNTRPAPQPRRLPKFMMLAQPVADPGGEYVRVKVTNPKQTPVETISIGYNPL